MKLNSREQATDDFYQWEYLGRGRYLFQTPVDIEPPYTPFIRNRGASYSDVDDGRVPSVFSRLAKLFITEHKEEIEEPQIQPVYLDVKDVPNLVGISLSFSGKYEIQVPIVIGFLNILSCTRDNISFEILGSVQSIRIHIVCSEHDLPNIESQLKAYFPHIITTPIDPMEHGFLNDNNIVISDFGLSEEYMRPIATTEHYKIDPLTSIIGSFELLQEGEVALIQVIFKGVSAPWSRDIPFSVSDGKGGSFFMDAPEMLNCAKEKISQPLYSVIMRMAIEGKSKARSNYLAQTISNHISNTSNSGDNKLVPLSNEGYNYDFHWYNLVHRSSNRLGFILNTKELATFVHYPNSTVISEYLNVYTVKTRAISKSYQNEKYTLGTNYHRGAKYHVGVSDEQKLRHSHIVGVTGVGKSTLLSNMIIDDMNQGNGIFLFDPHGDIVEDVLARVPEHRIPDVIVVDPYDTEFPIGFNLLHATTDAEKIVLSSDMVGAFKRYATSWGDNMSSVLSQAVNTFLESTTGGTLIELKRFLLEDDFRERFLQKVDDPSIHYYWNNEYSYLKKRIAPLLTRIDTFLRPKIIRYMLAQKRGIDFKECIDQKKIVLLKLSQGLIGEENSYLLGSLFLSKINQVALGRQSLPKHKRHPFYVYLDEFQNFVTPSISSILSGARKYGLGLILAHQELAQIDDHQVFNSILSNPNIRICFKLGDADAKRLNDGFTHFDSQDLQSLGVGETIMRIGSNSDDCNMQTSVLPAIQKEVADTTRKTIIQNTRDSYAQTKAEVETLLEQLLPKMKKAKSVEKKSNLDIGVVLDDTAVPKAKVVDIPKEKETVSSSVIDNPSLETQKQEYLKNEEEKEQIRKHRSLQNYVRTVAQQHGYVVRVEKGVEGGGRIDVALSNEARAIAVEISVTNSIDYEVRNIQKCINAQYPHIYMLCENETHLANIKKRAKKGIDKQELEKVTFMSPSQLAEYLGSFDAPKDKTTERVRGYRIKSNRLDINDTQTKEKNSGLRDVIISSIKKVRKK